MLSNAKKCCVMLRNTMHCHYAKKGKLWANEERNEETVDTERQKICLLPVPRAAAAYAGS